MEEKSPILNSPYHEPDLYYATDVEGALNYEDVRSGRRIFVPDTPSVPEKQKQVSAFNVNDFEPEYGLHLINLVRKEVGQWRKDGYPNVTRVSKDLLNFWFENEERVVTENLFFAQREAIETAVWSQTVESLEPTKEEC